MPGAERVRRSPLGWEGRPRAGEAEPRAGEAQPKPGEAEPRAGEAEPRAGEAEPNGEPPPDDERNGVAPIELRRWRGADCGDDVAPLSFVWLWPEASIAAAAVAATAARWLAVAAAAPPELRLHVLDAPGSEPSRCLRYAPAVDGDTTPPCPCEWRAVYDGESRETIGEAHVLGGESKRPRLEANTPALCTEVAGEDMQPWPAVVMSALRRPDAFSRAISVRRSRTGWPGNSGSAPHGSARAHTHTANSRS